MQAQLYVCPFFSFSDVSGTAGKSSQGFKYQPDGWESVEGDLAWNGVEWRNRGDKFLQSVPVCSIKANSLELQLLHLVTSIHREPGSSSKQQYRYLLIYLYICTI